jgi:hypothetical protein
MYCFKKKLIVLLGFLPLSIFAQSHPSTMTVNLVNQLDTNVIIDYQICAHNQNGEKQCNPEGTYSLVAKTTTPLTINTPVTVGDSKEDHYVFEVTTAATANNIHSDYRKDSWMNTVCQIIQEDQVMRDLIFTQKDNYLFCTGSQ